MATRGLAPTPRANNAGGFGLFRTAVLGLTKALTLGVSSVAAAPLHAVTHPDNEPEAEGSSFWPLMGASIALVLLGGAFAGLTIA